MKLYAPSIIQKNGNGEIIAIAPLRAVEIPGEFSRWNVVLRALRQQRKIA